MYVKRGFIIMAFSVLLLCCSAVIRAQDDVEYKWEIGGGLGMMTYTGDFNGNILGSESMAPDFSLLLRRTFNPYSHLRMALTYGTLRGRSDIVDTFYPDFDTQRYEESARETYEFSNPLIDVSAIYEYNFWPYGTGRDYRGARRLSPFLAIGLGFTYANCKDGWYDAPMNVQNNQPVFGAPEMRGNGAFTVNMPLGFGVKYKMGARTNLALEWICHFSLSDKLDGVKDPYRISSGGMFKNTDCYSALQATVTYSFGPKCKTCMNSDWR